MSFFSRFKKDKNKDKQPGQPSQVVIPQKDKRLGKAKSDTKPILVVESPKEKKVGDERKSEKPRVELYGILLRPLITEKATNSAQFNQYIFAVSTKANKIQIARAIQSRYGIKPIKINIINNAGKNVRSGRVSGRTKDWKKAIVTLPKGKTIQIQEGI